MAEQSKENHKALLMVNNFMDVAHSSRKTVSITKLIFTITRSFNISDRKLRQRIEAHQFVYPDMVLDEDGDTITWKESGD